MWCDILHEMASNVKADTRLTVTAQRCMQCETAVGTVLVTNLTHKWLFVRVHSVVRLETGPSFVCLPTHVTRKWLPHCWMKSRMSFQTSFKCERLATYVTMEWFLSRMQWCMRFQSSCYFKRFPTNITIIRWSKTMKLLMCLETTSQGESLATCFTAKRFPRRWHHITLLFRNKITRIYLFIIWLISHAAHLLLLLSTVLFHCFLFTMEPVDKNIARSQGIMNIQSLHLPSSNSSNTSSCDMLKPHFLEDLHTSGTFFSTQI